MDILLIAVLAWGTALMAISLYLGKLHEQGRRFKPIVRRGLFWACCTFMVAFSSLLVITGWLGHDAANFLIGLVAGYFAVLFIRGAGGPTFTQPGRFPFSARVML